VFDGWSAIGLLNDPVLPFVDFANVIDILSDVKGRVPVNNVLQRWIQEIDDHRTSINMPLHQVILRSRLREAQ
jgi:hypothetical protein